MVRTAFSGTGAGAWSREVHRLITQSDSRCCHVTSVSEVWSADKEPSVETMVINLYTRSISYKSCEWDSKK